MAQLDRAVEQAVEEDFVIRQCRFPQKADGPRPGLMGTKDWLVQHLADLPKAIANFRCSESGPNERQAAKEFIGAVLLNFCVRPAANSTENRIISDSRIRLLHEFFGNPFHPLPPGPETITPLAERIYAGEWNLMPLLGEWLQEHGYWSQGEHCLDPKVHHVKGCWVVDWVTGRE